MMVSQVFDAVAAEYDGPRRRLIPCFDLFYGTVTAVAGARLAAVTAAGGRPALLDLGAGTGLLAGAVAAATDDVTVTLLDGAPTMLDVATRRLAAIGVPHQVLVADLRDPLPAGPFDAVVSALAIHHLDDDGKRDLYARVYQVLAPGGVFVNAEQVAGPTAALDRRYHETWLAECRATGATEEDLAGAAERMAYDLPATVDDQCAWLREAGFANVDCYAKAWRFAVFGGVRAG
jgi:tRNA (cmo5U34)-methyltransferase